LFEDAVAKTKAIGSSTMVMAILDEEDSYLKTVNLGDSGYLLLRSKKDDIGNFE